MDEEEDDACSPPGGLVMYEFFLQYIDAPVIRLLHGLSHQSALFDTVVVKVLTRHTLKIFPFVLFIFVVFYVLQREGRTRLLANSTLGALLAMAISRLLQNHLPARPRPLFSDLQELLPPVAPGHTVLRDWSSFPSDTAALVAALTVSVWFYNRRAGALFALWSVVIVCLPRIYAGLHYPSDILAGALLGVACACTVQYAFRDLPDNIAKYSLARFPLIANCAIVAFLFQMSIMFDDVRSIGRDLAHTLSHDAVIADTDDTASANLASTSD